MRLRRARIRAGTFNFRRRSRGRYPMTNQEMSARARARIPGGTQLLSSRPELFAPGEWPGYYTRAKGVECWDLEGNRFVDMSITGVGSCALGFADPDVDNAVKAAIDNGSMC